MSKIDKSREETLTVKAQYYLLLFEQIELTVKLHKLTSSGLNDSTDADKVRERMNDINHILAGDIATRLKNLD